MGGGAELPIRAHPDSHGRTSNAPHPFESKKEFTVGLLDVDFNKYKFPKITDSTNKPVSSY